VFGELACQSRHAVERCRREEERFDVVGQTGQHGRHSLNALAPVGVGVLVGEGTIRDERVEERCESLVCATVERLVVVAKMLFSETFEDENHYIHWAKLGGIGRKMDRREDAFHLLLWHVVGGDKRSLVEGADDGKRGVEDNARFACLVDVLVGVADSDGTCGSGEATTHSCYAEWHQDGKEDAVEDVIGRLVEHGNVGGTSEEFPEGNTDDDSKKHQIPVCQELLSEDYCHVASTFVAKFL